MLKNTIIEIFVNVDDFCKEFDVEIKKQLFLTSWMHYYCFHNTKN